MATEANAPETHAFQAEVNQVLRLVINSLYSHPEVFLRELVSNASDALDKRRFEALTDHAVLEDSDSLEIRVLADDEAGTLTIEDTGIGMNRDELIANLGTIARSGSRELLEKLKQAKEQKDLSLIGQFGVGFYSAFLVADHVEVVTRRAGETEAWLWKSDAQDAFTIEPAERDEVGTSILLHLKDDQKEHASEWKLRELIHRYSDYVQHPIKLRVTRTEGEGDEAKETTSLETVNQGKALWQRPKSEIEEPQYNEFYKHLTHAYEDPIAHTHFQVEGARVTFTGLLFIPSSAPFDLMQNDQRRGVRLYVKRVFIMDDCEELLPAWLRFVRGIIDSEDLPLNVSRELLQDNAVVRAIRKQIVKKTLDLIEDIAKNRPDAYENIWKEFGIVLKEGLHYEPEYKERLAELVRFVSSQGDEFTSFADYLERMPEDQPAIYTLLADSREQANASPHAEGVRKKGYEVLYLTDSIDHFIIDRLDEYQGKPIISVMKADLALDEEESTDDEEKSEELRGVEALLTKMRVVLQDHVQEVRASKRLVDSPVCLVVPEGGVHAATERLMKNSPFKAPETKRILEVNPKHPVIQNLVAWQEKDSEATVLQDWIELLHDEALLTEGSPVKNPEKFARRMSDLFARATAPPKE